MTIDEVDAICARTPILADLRPAGRFVATDVFAAGGLGVLMQRLLSLGHVVRMGENAPAKTGI